TGYSFLYPVAADLTRARQERSEVKSQPSWTLAYETSDPLARVAAERIALNAHDAGLDIQLNTTAAGDLRLVRVPLSSSNAQAALRTLSSALGLVEPRPLAVSVDI